VTERGMGQYFSDFQNFIRTTTTTTTTTTIGAIIIILIISQKLTNGLINHTICQQW
jgi:hypothetical protein